MPCTRMYDTWVLAVVGGCVGIRADVVNVVRGENTQSY